MKTDWFLLLIPFFVGLLIGGLPCLIAVDPLQKGKPFQKVLEDVPAKFAGNNRSIRSQAGHPSSARVAKIIPALCRTAAATSNLKVITPP
jgi:hypothetical protein